MFLPERRSSTDEPEQLVLPLDIRPQRKVSWLNIEKKRRLFRNNEIANFILTSDSCVVAITEINVDDIPKLQDPNLRYALRFADAANALGWSNDGHGMSTAHHVAVVATAQGFESQLHEAIYTGLGEGLTSTFVDALRSAAPPTSNNA